MARLPRAIASSSVMSYLKLTWDPAMHSAHTHTHTHTSRRHLVALGGGRRRDGGRENEEDGASGAPANNQLHHLDCQCHPRRCQHQHLTTHTTTITCTLHTPTATCAAMAPTRSPGHRRQKWSRSPQRSRAFCPMREGVCHHCPRSTIVAPTNRESKAKGETVKGTGDGGRGTADGGPRT
jgi:hypothetical protein